jgi:hypothetical protein
MKNFKNLSLSPSYQITSAVASVWNNLWQASGSEFRGYGLLNNHIILDAAICYHINCLFPMEDEQRLRTRDVCVIFCIRCRFASV